VEEDKKMENVQQPKTPLLVSKREAAALLGVCLRSVDNYITSKELPFRRLGKRILIPYSALQGFAKRDHPGFGSGAKSSASLSGGSDEPQSAM
jgi:excisionase family DNA binding protein